jgi:hypothetical protein
MSTGQIALGIGSALLGRKGDSKQTSQVTTDPRQQAMYEDLYRRAQGIAAQPFVPYTGSRVAGFSPDQLRAFEATRGLFETGMQFDPLTDIRGIAEAPIPSLLSTDISAYQSPYQQQVIDQTMADIQRQADIARGFSQDQAIGAGAFGGSRSAILEAESQRPYAETMARTAAGLRQAGFEQAQRAAEADIARQMRGREFQAGLLGGISAEQQRRLGMLGGIGTQQQALQQRALDIPYQEFQRALAYPTQQFGLLSESVFGQPVQQTTTEKAKATPIERLGGIADIYSLGANIFGI